MKNISKTTIATILLLLLLLGTGVTSFGETSLGETTYEEAPFRVIGYYSADLFDEPVEGLQTDKLTHVMYAFLIPQEDGTCLPPPKPEQLRALVAQAHRDGAQVFIALGGWSYQGEPLAPIFESVTAEDALRNTLVDSVMEVVHQYHLDGVEVDWEYPTTQSADNYEKLVLSLSQRLGSEGKQLTAALNGAWSETAGPEVSSLVSEACLNAFSFISVMAYDMNNEQHSPFWFAGTSIAYWIHRGVPAEKIVLGMPLYARPSWAQFRHLVSEDPAYAYTDHAVSAAGESYYNGLPTLCRKTILAYEKAGGVMLFDVNEDAKGSLSTVSMIDSVRTDLEQQGCLSSENIALIQRDGGVAELKNAVGWDYTKGVKRMRFTDMTPSDWFYEDVQYVYQQGQMKGLSQKTFAPNDPMTRAMLVTILYRLEMGKDSSAAPQNDNSEHVILSSKSEGSFSNLPSSISFTDVTPGSWYEDAVNWAAARGIVNGVGEGRFQPGSYVTREQAVTILWRWMTKEDSSAAPQNDNSPEHVILSSKSEGSFSHLPSPLPFTDADRINPWAEDAMRWGVASCLIRGRENDLLAPQGTITRAEAAALLRRLP